jgi:light-regulated signal transduction histidine kinase (bacteriophytochrome)
MAKKIGEICNGTIWIESELGLGITFFVELNK